ncbi:MAG: hypothetical protein HY908_36350 [Myxococcales bacterium]|nr:hypothetical protein [Myxococcales bacterium]
MKGPEGTARAARRLVALACVALGLHVVSAPACGKPSDEGSAADGGGAGGATCSNDCATAPAEPCCEGSMCWLDSFGQCGLCDVTCHCVAGAWDCSSSCNPPCTGGGGSGASGGGPGGSGGGGATGGAGGSHI